MLKYLTKTETHSDKHNLSSSLYKQSNKEENKNLCFLQLTNKSSHAAEKNKNSCVILVPNYFFK